MPIKHSLWSVGNPPTQLDEAQLPSELTLHNMIKSAPELLSPDWMLIGSEVQTIGGRLDLLAIAPDGSLVLIELKRDKTPRDVVAQALDYASWVEQLSPDRIAAIYQSYSDGEELSAGFASRFGRPLIDDELNGSHEVVIVASELDAATERIVEYLNRRGIAINVLFFRVFQHGAVQLLSRAWLVDPVEAQTSTPVSQAKEPWNNEYYVSYGTGESRSWAEAREYGFICAGGGSWYSRTLKLLSQGDRVWVNIPGQGYVGVGIVVGPMLPLSEFQVMVDGVPTPALQVLHEGNYHQSKIDDEESCEYFVPVRWCQTVPQENAVRETGFFGNQNTVAAPRAASWRSTVERLKVAFPKWDQPPAHGFEAHNLDSGWL